MQQLPLHLYQDYLRFKSEIPQYSFPFPLLNYNDVLKAHYLICDYFETNQGISSVYGVRSMQLLGSALGRQITSFAGVNKWKNDFEVMASLFFGLVKNHPFHDGNKRSALLALLYNLYLIKKIPKSNQDAWEQLTVSVAASDMSQYKHFKKFEEQAENKEDAIVYFIANFLQKNTRSVDNVFVSITYADFETSIKQFGFYFKNPSKNCIDIYQKCPRKILGVTISGEIHKRVKNIAFPGYRCQMDSKTQKNILKDLGLTPEKGFDRQVLSKSAEPLYKIIQDYEGPLSRLKDQ